MRTTSRSRRPPHLLFTTLLALSLTSSGLFPASVFAQSQEGVARARELYQQGVEAYQNEQFERAIALFDEAYTHDPHPMFLYNMSVAHSRLGKTALAHHTAGRIYDAADLPGDTKLRNAARFYATGAALRAEQIATNRAAAIIQAQRAKLELQARIPSEPPPTAEVVQRSPLTALGWSGVGTAATGVTLMIVAGIISSSLEPDLTSYDNARRAGDHARMAQLGPRIESTQATGKYVLFGGVGLALVGAGFVTYDFIRGDGTEASLSVAAGGSSLGVSLRF